MIFNYCEKCKAMTPVSFRVSIGGDVWQCQNCACIIFSAKHSDEAGDRYMELIDDAVEMFRVYKSGQI